MDEVIYPVSRLLADPKLFYAIARHIGGPDGETLKEAFYDLLEHGFEDLDAEECEFEAQEACFRVREDGEVCEIILDSGIMSVLEAIQGEIRAQITDDDELAATSAIYQRLVNAIEEASPDLAGDIALSSPPTPGNEYLRSADGERFEGSFHLLSDPEKVYAFSIQVIDIETDKLQATIHPM
jgi:hypothetical protein